MKLPSKSDIVKVLVVAVVTISLSRMLVYVPLSVSFFASSGVADINQFDIYSDLQQAQGMVPYEDNIVMVTLPEGSTRYELAEALLMLSECNPAAVAVDVELRGGKDPDIDAILIDAIKACNNVVVPCKADCLDDTTRFFASARELGTRWGYTNLDTRGRDNAVIRSFTTFYVDTNTCDTIYSLPLQAVKLVAPERVRELVSHHTSREYINFTIDFLTLSYEEIPDWAEEINGAIVMLGVDTRRDVYRTSIDTHTLGLKIHAYTATTVLRSAYIRPLGNWVTQVFAFVVIAFFVALNIYFSRHFPRAGGFLVRTTNYILFFSLLISSFVLFSERAVYSDCGWFLMAIAFCPWATDIYTLLHIFVHKIAEWWRVLRVMMQRRRAANKKTETKNNFLEKE